MFYKQYGQKFLEIYTSSHGFRFDKIIHSSCYEVVSCEKEEEKYVRFEVIQHWKLLVNTFTFNRYLRHKQICMIGMYILTSGIVGVEQVRGSDFLS